MDDYQFLTLICMFAAIFITVVGGFSWIIFWLRSIEKDVSNIHVRLAVIECKQGCIIKDESQIKKAA